MFISKIYSSTEPCIFFSTIPTTDHKLITQPINNSMELEECPSSASSQASSTDGFKMGHDWYSDEDDITLNTTEGEAEHLYQQCIFNLY